MSTITGTITNTVTIGTSGNYASPLTVASSGAVETSGTAIYGPNTQAWTVADYGTIEATGAGSIGVYLEDGGSVANTGSTAVIEGGAYGVKIAAAAGTVANAGTISGTTDAI
ncbi:MAG TPA: hypothetical protein VM782_11885, partial [Stellaceae bacterium]|nr:hypothetical protein [Stellaceae bacterium]